eukprot:1088645-Rhodomonas_salina.1
MYGPPLRQIYCDCHLPGHILEAQFECRVFGARHLSNNVACYPSFNPGLGFKVRKLECPAIGQLGGTPEVVPPDTPPHPVPPIQVHSDSPV